MRPSATGQHHRKARRTAWTGRPEGWRTAAAGGDAWSGPWALRTATLRIRLAAPRMPRGQLVEAAARQTPDLAVAQCADAARALAGDNSDISPTMLPGGISAIRIGLRRVSSVSVAEHAEAAAWPDIDCIGRLALVEQRGAAGSTSRLMLLSIAAMLCASRSANNGARCSALRNRSLAGSRTGATMLIRRSSVRSLRCSCALHALAPSRSSGRRATTPSPAICRRWEEKRSFMSA